MTWEQLQALVKSGAKLDLSRRMQVATISSIEPWTNTFKIMHDRTTMLTVPSDTPLTQTALQQWSFTHEGKLYYIMVRLEANDI